MWSLGILGTFWSFALFFMFHFSAKYNNLFQKLCHFYFVFQITFHQSTQLAASCAKMTLYNPGHENSGGKPRSEVDVRFGQPAFHQRSTSVQPAFNQRSTSGQRVEILLGISHCVAAGNLKTLMINHLGKSRPASLNPNPNFTKR